MPGSTSTRERATLQCQPSYLLGSRGGGSGSGLGSKCVSNHVPGYNRFFYVFHHVPNMTMPMVLSFEAFGVVWGGFGFKWVSHHVPSLTRPMMLPFRVFGWFGWV